MSRRPDTSSGRLSKMSPAAPSKILRFIVFSTLLITPIAPRLTSAQSSTTKRDWAVNGGEPNNTHSSPLAQINRENVRQLRVAWSYDTGERGGGANESDHCGRGAVWAFAFAEGFCGRCGDGQGDLEFRFGD